ncbi:MAG: hypothetical protein AUH85_11985 [Chloroflexi bacterium 13_1_40CM_4_68_4]|nr:MAG: hypothetical protein AUH85_11985 [Chloroflexi bacterium 13_1_40CM_4_68_4]
MSFTPGRLTTVNDEVRALAVAPPRALRRPAFTVTTYFVSFAIRALGLNVSTVCVAFQARVPGTTPPVTLFVTTTPSPAESLIGWLKVTTASCHGPP